MSEFNKAIDTVLKHEGGYINDPDDSGGATNFGISLRYLKTLGTDVGDLDCDGDIDEDDILLLEKSRAVGIYRNEWWDRYKYWHIDAQHIATKTLDLSINMGSHRAHKCLQHALRACGKNLKVDGILGPKTFAAANSVDSYMLLGALRSEAASVYRIIAISNKILSKYLNGWLNRAYS